ncbi:MAG: GNAT family N-acetyltransferase [Methanosarcinales archaeon]|nr:GNAT family N-acetyltransferase [Methanosarcinales archaeon]
MLTRLSYNELKIVSYTERHDVSHFESKTTDLNSFLKDDAFENQEELISKTYLCCHSNQLVGYITLTTDIIKKEEIQEEERIDVPYKEYPAIKIARLAVDKKYERRGVGRFLLLVAVGKALKISNEVGCRFITVDSKQDSIGFYEKRGGFELVQKHKNRTYPTMYLDILPINEEMKAVNTELADFQTPMN